jgi:uncharacterized repeat protein (TIGR03803 family)
VTKSGGSDGGTVFKINTDGTGFAVLHSFAGGDGVMPLAGLTLSGSTLFGTTRGGGRNFAGTVFKMNTDGTGFAVLHHFTGGGPTGSGARLVLSGNTLYGTTDAGGNQDLGMVFKVNTDGTGFAVLHNFAGNLDGAMPLAGLTLSGNTLYGTTAFGGSRTGPTDIRRLGLGGFGTVFKIDTDGTDYSILSSFTGGIDGAVPQSNVTLFDGKLYGTAPFGGHIDYSPERNGTEGDGVVFALNLTSSPGNTGIKGLVLKRDVGRRSIPLANARVEVSPTAPPGALQSDAAPPSTVQVTKTDRNGRFQVSTGPGHFQVTVTKPNLDFIPVKLQVEEGDITEVTIYSEITVRFP